MTPVTRCPQCSTRFKVAQEQLDSHGGLVRCGRCQAVFNANAHLCDTGPSPQLSLPIMLEEEPEPPAAPEESARNGAAPASAAPAGEDAATPLEQQIAIAPEPHHPARKPARNQPAWPWAAGSLLLAVVLLAQAAYYFRIGLAARLPALKPALLSYCALLGCNIPLPGKAELVNIESSDMEADAAQPGAITLNASLRNRAPYAQAYPSLELTLTDTQDKVVARRSFHPAEYLKPGEDGSAGLPPGREAGIKLHLDVADLRPTGYRLFLYYPQ